MNIINGNLSSSGELYGILSPVEIGLEGSLSIQSGVSGTLTVPECVSPETYEGAYTITPTNSAQTILVADLLMRDNITVEAIPHNYGLITWNGAYLAIS